MDPSFKRTPRVPIETIPGTLPIASVSEDVDHAGVAAEGLKMLTSLTRENLTKESIWRDQWALTGTSRTFSGPSQVFAAWKELAATRKPDNFSLIPNTSRITASLPDSAWVQASFAFTLEGAPACLCSGFIGLVPDNAGGWKIWMLSTILETFKGYPNPDTPPPQPSASTHTNGVNGFSDEYSYDCVVVGGGMAGLSVAGRLKAMNVSSVTLERNAHIGDNWLMRYDSTKSHLPFSRTFSAEDGYFLTSSKIAQGFQRYVKTYGINVWGSSDLKTASWNAQKKLWNLQVERQNPSCTVIINTPHVVLCLGAGGQVSKMPTIPNREAFGGIVMHSKDYKSSNAWSGKNGVVVGSANTAHDVAFDMVESHLRTVTMIQRNPTALYNDFIPVEVADKIYFGLPLSISRQILLKVIRNEVDKHSERYDSLERAGFKLDRYCDPQEYISVRLGGHHIDVGAGKKITSGQIKMKSDAAIKQYTPTGLEFADGSHLDVDVIVFCTGFEGNMRESATEIFGSEVANGLEDFFGVDAEGEILGAWRRQGYPGIWYNGGTIVNARYYSRFIALQIKADLEGMPLPLYKKTPA
ncbi:Flavin-containing monooxygenase YUCCA3 [Hyphodiscus hymeniophilus]|uniref:Flavin-containing monooxygenase YUCCA3 n=1 Tax=Hyphodiscus hymeniophilus TaxID=353542 RepID=A0A9P6VDN9_9HELO|nr:Flavin-containing monooxygenase YUCCA3 [Hyphodiscus hymeniophilus]